MSLTWRTVPFIPVLAVALALVACRDDGGETSSSEEPPIDVGDPAHYDPQVDPAEFVAVIDNAFLPFASGSRWGV